MNVTLKKALSFLSYILVGAITSFINYKLGLNPETGYIIGFITAVSLDFIDHKYKKEEENND